MQNHEKQNHEEAADAGDDANRSRPSHDFVPYDSVKSEGQWNTQRRESASAAANHFVGMIALKNRCVRLMMVYLVGPAGFGVPPSADPRARSV